MREGNPRASLGLSVFLVGVLLCIPGLARPLPVPTGRESELPHGARVGHSRTSGLVSFLAAPPGSDLGPGSVADALARWGSHFGCADPDRQLALTEERTDRHGFRRTTFRQVHRGVPVFSGKIHVHTRPDGKVHAINGDFYPLSQKLAVTPSLTREEAIAEARAICDLPEAPIARATLRIVDPGWYGDPFTGARLVFHVELGALAPFAADACFIDARTGALLDRWSLLHGNLDRRVHDAGGTDQLPGPLARDEGDGATGEVEVDATYDYLGDTYDYFFRAFGRDSLDDNGLPLVATVDSDNLIPCPNAVYHPMLHQIVLCDGLAVDDLIAHEVVHGLTIFTADLILQNQPGQLNEHFSDVFGELVDLFNGDVAYPGAPGGPSWPGHGTGPGIDTPNLLRSTCSHAPGYPDGVRWLHAEGAPAYGGAVRDLWDPTCLAMPDRTSNPLLYCEPLDFGQIHSGSLVPSHAFVMATDGKSFNGYSPSALGPIKTGAVWYRALTTYLTEASDYRDAYDALLQSAQDLVGTTPSDPRTGGASSETFTAGDVFQIEQALQAVELDLEGICGEADVILRDDAPPPCPQRVVLFSDDFEGGAPGWQVSNTNPPTAYDWVVRSALPFGRGGSAWFAEDRAIGNCGSQDESGVHYLQSPPIVLPGNVDAPRLEFTHYLRTEPGRDGGVIEIRKNGGPWQSVGRPAFLHNPYNARLWTAGQGSTNPLGGREGWSGAGGEWGTSVVDLSGTVTGGDTLEVRFALGKDGCDGTEGWYVDDVLVYDCPDCDGNGRADDRDLRFTFHSADLGPLGDGQPRSVTVSAPPAPRPGTEVTIRVSVSSTLFFGSQHVEVRLDGTPVGYLFATGGSQCPEYPNVQELRLPASLFASSFSGDLTIGIFTPNGMVPVSFCDAPFSTISLEYTAGRDCNGNGIVDACDVTSGIDTDCDGNGVLDTCEELAPVDEISSTLTPVVSGTPLTFTIPNAPLATTDVTLFLTGEADLVSEQGQLRYLEVELNGMPIGAAFVAGAVDCPDGPSNDTLFVDASDFNALVAGQDANFTFTPTMAVDACTPSSFLEARVAYAATTDRDCDDDGLIDDCEDDCNGNGVPDDCETLTDCNANGVPDVCESLGPTIAQAPASVVECAGASVTLQVSATGTGPLGYQWRKDGVDLPAETAADLTLADLESSDEGSYTCRVTSACDSVVTPAADLTVETMASVDPATGGGNYCPGSDVTLTANAFGTPPLDYQWRRDGADLPGATTATLSISDISASDAGSYDCVVTNGCGTATSAATGVTVTTVPSVSGASGGGDYCPGSDVTLAVTAQGSGPLSYQWRRDGANVSGATQSALLLNDLSAADAGSYDCRVGNSCGSDTSAPTSITVVSPLGTGTVLGGGTFCVGDSATLVATVSGSAPIAYQWRRNGVVIPGATQDTLALTAITLSDAGAYDCVLTNPCGTQISAAGDVTVEAGPLVTGVSGGGSFCAGDDVTLTINASGGAGLAYQWRRNGSPLGSADSASLSLTNVGAGDAGSYDCVVTDACGSAVSPATAIAVDDPPTVGPVAGGGGFCDGDDATLTVTAAGSSPLTYQWRRNGIDLPGATGATLTLSNLTATDAGSYDCVVTNACGAETAAAADIAIGAGPMVGVVTGGGSACAGSDVTLAVTASGSGPLSYQWRRNGVPLAGATQDTLGLTNVASGDAGSYACAVTNPCGSANSAAAIVTVEGGPVVAGVGGGGTFCAGDTVTLTVNASGGAGLAYQWRRNGSPLGGADSASLSLTNVDAGDAGSYDCVVTDACGSVVSPATAIAVDDPPTVGPVAGGGGFCDGDDATLTVTAGGSSPLTYQWRRNGIDLPGATGATLTLSNLTATDAGSYDCVVTNACGAETAAAADIAIGAGPMVGAVTGGGSACAGSDVTLSVTASGSGPLSYQWRLNGVPLAGATQDTLGLTNVASGDAGSYACAVTNPCGSANSAAAIVTVEAGPVVAGVGGGGTFCAGDTVTLTVNASGGAGLAYQWRRNGSPLGSADSASLSLTNVGAGDAGSYDCVVTDACGSAVSPATAIAVDDPPTVGPVAGGGGFCDGDDATLTVTAAGSSPLTYQWRRNGIDLPGATGATLTLSNLTATDAGSYDCVVTNACGAETAAAADIAIGAGPMVGAVTGGGSACAGSDVTLAVTASGSGPLSYQWRLDGSDLPGASSNVLDLPSVDASDAGSYACVVSNACGTATSPTTDVLVATPPAVGSVTGGGSVCSGDDVTLFSAASGSMPLSYQWQRNGADLPGATTDTLVLTDVTVGDTGDYRVVVANGCGADTSAPVSVTVETSPSVTGVSGGGSFCVGTDVTLGVNATGTGPFTYQWRRNGIDLAGATTNTLDLLALDGTDAGSYDCTVGNACGSTLAAPTDVIVETPPTVGSVNGGGSVCAGSDVTLQVTAAGTSPLAFQWQRDGSDIPGATTDTLTLVGVSAADSASYRVVVTNSCASVTSAPVSVDVESPPPPANVSGAGSYCLGDDVTLSVSVTGSAPFTYQWRRNGADLSGATLDTLGITDVDPTAAGAYDCVVTNGCGSIITPVVDLVVDTPPTVGVVMGGGDFCDGVDVTLQVVAGGTMPLAYQWQKDGNDLSGATGDTLLLTDLTAADTGSYRVVVTNGCGTATSAETDLALLPSSQCGITFLRGDVDASGSRNLADGIRSLNWVFVGNPPVCLSALDADDDGMVNLADSILTLGYVFGMQPAFPPPFTTCGPDPTPDSLDCATFPACP